MTLQIGRASTLPPHGVGIGCQFLGGMGDMPMHCHTFVEIALVMAGSAIHRTTQAERRLGRGSCVVIRPGQRHEWFDAGDLSLWNIYVGPEVLQHELRWFRESPAGHALLSLPAMGAIVERYLTDAATERVSGWLEVMPARTERGLPADAARVACLLAALGEIADGLDDGEAGAPEALSDPVLRVIARLEQDLSRAWSLDQMAEVGYVSIGHLCREFTRVTGMPPMTYLARLRAEWVATELIEGTRPISEIGRDVGWNDANYLSRRFRHFFGIAPREFRAHFGRAAMVLSP